MKRVLFFTVSVVVMALGLCFSASAQTSVAGKWDAAMNTPGGAVPFKLEFKVEGEKLTGTVIRANGNVPLEGTIKGSDISFAYTITYNGHDLTLGFTGKLTGDKIAGTVSFGGQAEDEWSATREPSKDNRP